MKRQQINRGFWNYFQTPAGRSLVFAGAACTTLGLFVGNFVPHAMGLKQYRKFVQCYQEGVERPVPEEVKERLEIAMNKLDLGSHERKFIKPFTVFGFDLFQAGSTKFRFGALVGIPINYSFSSADDIKRDEISFRNNKIDWNSESGRMLQYAMVLDEDEQIFGLCKSIMQAQTHRALMNSIFPSVSFLTVYTIGRYLNMRLDFFVRPMSMRVVMYTILGLFGFGSWSFMTDFNQVSYDADIDKRLSEMGPQFVEAGIRFYDKQLKKNMALRALIGDDTYTAKGNVNYLLRQKSMPLTVRKSYFENCWKQLQSTQAASELAQ